MLYLYIQSVKTVCDPLRHPLFSNFTAHRSRSFDLPCIVCQQKLSHNDIIHMYLTSMYIYIYTRIFYLFYLVDYLLTHSLTFLLAYMHVWYIQAIIDISNYMLHIISTHTQMYTYSYIETYRIHPFTHPQRWRWNRHPENNSSRAALALPQSADEFGSGFFGVAWKPISPKKEMSWKIMDNIVIGTPFRGGTWQNLWPQRHHRIHGFSWLVRVAYQRYFGPSPEGGRKARGNTWYQI